MKNRLPYLIIYSLFLPILAYAQQTMPVDEVKPGMIAIAKTVFKDNKIEDFEVEVVDVMRDFLPKRDVIIVRLKGDKAVFTGPTSGMSGSPVYYEGRLIGALAYSWSAFLRDPLMGITPISDMLEIVEREKTRASEQASIGNREAYDRSLATALGMPPEPPMQGGSDDNLDGFAGFSKLGLPLHFSGVSDGAFAWASETLQQYGVQALRAGASSEDPDAGGELIPGAPVAAVLMSGDVSIAATGTVTWRDGNQVLGFGHSFFGNGSISLPLAQARILTVISSDLSSQKMSATGKIVGTLWQDRSTGIMGSIGVQPEMVPVSMRYTDESGNASAFSFNIAQERSLAWILPLVMRIGLISGLESARLSTGINSLAVTGGFVLASGDSVRLDNFYAGYQPLPMFSFLNSGLQSTGQIAAALAAVTNNPFAYSEFKSVWLDFKAVAGRQSATIERIWTSQSGFEPGETLDIFCRVRPYQGQARTKRLQITVPASFAGRTLQVLVGGAMHMSGAERRYLPGAGRAESLRDLLKVLREVRRNDKIYVQLIGREQGAFVSGKAMPSLPPSISNVYKTDGTRTRPTVSNYSRLLEKGFAQPVMIEGVKSLRLRKQPGAS